MSKESTALLNAIHSIINKKVNDMVDNLLFKGSFNSPSLKLTNDELRALENISLTPYQISAIRKVMLAIGQGIVFSLLCIIDGVSYVDEIPDLALVNRNTKKDISEQFLHDEFIKLLPD